ncbi:MAG: GGDEF domain-containing protein [Actinomycetota bacterium]|nr:GGDEF domain-containing protein [Actinomycetota bacterium]
MWYLLGTEFAALCLTAATFHWGSSNKDALIRAIMLLAMSALYGEACDRIERLSQYLTTHGVVMNQNSVLCFAGVLILPTQLAAALVIGVYLHTFVRARRARVARPYRLAFTAGATVLATFAAGSVYAALGGGLASIGPWDALVVIVTLAVYTASNLVLLLVCLRLVTKPASWRSLLPSRHQVTYENSTLLLGSLTGIVVLHAVWLSPFILILIANLHRASLVTELQHSARTDAKTGLLNSGGWQLLARQHLAQCAGAGTSAAVLLIDLDHFKNVNDTYGHLAGDVVLKSVAETLARELRGYDAVGRYGGEEFIALLPGVEEQAALAIAERVRHRISSSSLEDLVHVTASVGVAVGQVLSGTELEDIIDAADIALYEAKSAGRDRVCLAPPVEIKAGGRLPGERRAFRAHEGSQPSAPLAEHAEANLGSQLEPDSHDPLEPELAGLASTELAGLAPTDLVGRLEPELTDFAEAGLVGRLEPELTDFAEAGLVGRLEPELTDFAEAEVGRPVLDAGTGRTLIQS